MPGQAAWRGERGQPRRAGRGRESNRFDSRPVLSFRIASDKILRTLGGGEMSGGKAQAHFHNL